MRSYKEIADIVREKGNTILEQKKKRTLCIKKVSFTISGIVKKCAVGEYPKSEIDRYQAA